MFILISVTVLALIFGAILGFASIKLKSKQIPSSKKLMPSYRKANVGNAAILAVSLMLKRLLMVTLSQNAMPGGRPTVVKLPKSWALMSL